MRSRNPLVWTALVATLALGAAASACDHSPPFVVERNALGARSTLISGDNMRVQKPAQDGYDGMKTGYHVVRSEEAWKGLFASGQERPLPASVDFSHQMVVVTSGTPEMEKTHVGRVVNTGNAIHVYVQDTMRGAECKAEKGTPPPYEIAIAERIDKNVVVHVDTEQLPSCGSAPTATVKCRLANAEKWSAKVEASPGDPVECEATIEAKGAFVVTDKTWQFSEVPGGSLTKMSFARENMRVGFHVDLFGTYKVVFEVTDEADRRGHANGLVEVVPVKSQDVFVQMVWAGFDRNDDPSTFPRVELVAHDVPPHGQKPKTCSVAETPKPDFCDIKTENYVTNLKLLGSSGHAFTTNVHYIDDRFDGGPYICMRVYLNGVRTTESCDRTKRSADETWSPGAIDGSTGMFGDEKETRIKLYGPEPVNAPPTKKKPAPKSAPKK